MVLKQQPCHVRCQPFFCVCCQSGLPDVGERTYATAHIAGSSAEFLVQSLARVSTGRGVEARASVTCSTLALRLSVPFPVRVAGNWLCESF